jgi:hypothetical protein
MYVYAFSGFWTQAVCTYKLGWVGYGLHGLVNGSVVYWIGLGMV